VVLTHRGSPPALSLTAGIDQPGLPLPYVAYIFYIDVTKIDRGMLHMFLETYYKRLFKMFHLFPDVCCNRFLFRCCICCNSVFQIFQLFQSYVIATGFTLQVFYFGCFMYFTHMLQKHILKCFICFQSLHSMLQVFYVVRPRAHQGPADGGAAVKAR
jgi:hypothetical protein